VADRVANHDVEAVLAPGMQVFLVPVGGGRFEPYCEQCDELHPEEVAAPEARGWVRSMWDRFRHVLAAAEHSRLDPQADAPSSWIERLKGRVLAYVAERIAEQRLLWQLRTQQVVQLVYPANLSEGDAQRTLRRSLQADGERHRRWALIDGLLMAVTGPLLFFIPGPNLVAYYFAFRAIGHWLSYRGARQGLDVIEWRGAASDVLAELGPLASLDPDERQGHLDAIASRLRLPHLARFFERVTFKGA
jgi:hypothetical protein